MHTTTNRRGKVRPRVLYWYRSPPDIKVGREPFDAAVRRALEAQNPDITFDWRAITDTPIPSADADKWRERRRAERAAKHAAAAEPATETAGSDPEADDVIAAAVDAEGPDEATNDTSETPDAVETSPAPDAPAADGQPNRDANRRRRRRVRNRGGGTPNGSPSSSSPSGTGS